ncbi:hypothetical protein [Puerhibacterium sp. TATVAM-FAB25]|uniref:hypothetical protein n=1 Tax=Puerhibacterium sp. TATVAM-FAB25 TaxID=3093699 RepID=UPI00397CD124
MRRTVASLAAAAVLATTAALIAPAAQAADNLGKWYYLSNGTKGGPADVTFAYGRSNDVTLIGDWDGDGKDTLAVRRGATYHLTNRTTGGEASTVFTYGRPGDVVLVGDWDGDGKDTLAVRRGATYHLSNAARGGQASTVFTYGRPGDVVLVGDWDGDGKDTLAVRRGATYHLSNGTRGGKASVVFSYGKADDVVLVGDWNGDGKDTLGVRRSSTYHLTNGTRGGKASIVFSYGKAKDVVLVGDWNADRKDTLGVRRVAAPYATIRGDGMYAVGSQAPVGRYKAKVPAGSECVVASLSDLSGTDDSIIDSAWADPGETIYWDVETSAAGFWTDGCGSWTQVFPKDTPRFVSPIGDGWYRVGIDIAPGVYKVVAPSYDADAWSCEVATVSAFRGFQTSFSDSYVAWPDEEFHWEVAPGDVGFYADSCGTLTKVSEAPTAVTEESAPSAARAADDGGTGAKAHSVNPPRSTGSELD